MSITVRYFARIRDITEKREEIISINEHESVLDFLNRLSGKYGEEFRKAVFFDKKPSDELTFLVNGKAIIDFNQTILKNDDVLSILPPISGG